MEAVRTALHKAEIDGRYWPISLQDAVFKYNLRTSETTGHTPLHDRLSVDYTLKRLLVFSLLGTFVHRHSTSKTKLQPRFQWMRYVHPVDQKFDHDNGSILDVFCGSTIGLCVLGPWVRSISCLKCHLQLQKCPRHSCQVVPMAPGPNNNIFSKHIAYVTTAYVTRAGDEISQRQ